MYVHPIYGHILSFSLNYKLHEGKHRPLHSTFLAASTVPDTPGVLKMITVLVSNNNNNT